MCVCGVCVCVCGGSERRGRPDGAARARGCTDVLECERMASEELVVRWWWDRRVLGGGAFPLLGSLAAQMQRSFNF